MSPPFCCIFKGIAAGNLREFMSATDTVRNLVERFEQHRDTYRSLLKEKNNHVWEFVCPALHSIHTRRCGAYNAVYSLSYSALLYNTPRTGTKLGGNCNRWRFVDELEKTW